MNKVELRKQLIAQRRSLSIADWQHKSRQLCEQLQQWPMFANAKTVLAYLSIRQEPDLSALFTLPKVWGLPRCMEHELVWHHWESASITDLQAGAFGILEPYPDAPLISPSAVDLLLVPTIACDAQGYRLGYGGGFYDRLFSNPVWANKPAIGIVFEFARLPHLPHDPWDIPLQAICTEAGILTINN